MDPGYGRTHLVIPAALLSCNDSSRSGVVDSWRRVSSAFVAVSISIKLSSAVDRPYTRGLGRPDKTEPF